MQAAQACSVPTHTFYAHHAANQSFWLEAMLSRNHTCDYLRQYGSPRTVAAFRAQVPLCNYEDLSPAIERIAKGASHILFTGRPMAYERTGGSSGGSKLIPYTAQGLVDFQRNLLPWLADTVRTFGITGRAYFSISPATRPPEVLHGIPLGLPDGAYLGPQASAALAQVMAVSPEVVTLTDVRVWQEATAHQLQAAHDLELISVWSPTFLLRLLDAMPNAPACWPRLKLISCWAHGPARRHAQELQQRLQATHPAICIQPKGLLATEGVMTVPWHSPCDLTAAMSSAHCSYTPEQCSPANARHQVTMPSPMPVHCIPAPHGFIELLHNDVCCLPHEAQPGQTYEVILTTASGLYRYRTGDHVLCTSQLQRLPHQAQQAQVPDLVFVGRDGLHSDLVGEKLTEAFVAHCLHQWPGYAVLLPDVARCGYVLVVEQAPGDASALHNSLVQLEQALSANPQYAYARRMGQLAPLRLCMQPNASAIVEQTLLQQGTRLGDIKPLALRTQAWWLPLLETTSS